MEQRNFKQPVNGQPIAIADCVDKAASEEPLWLTLSDVTERVRCGRKVIYRAVAAGKLRAAVINGRGDMRFRPEWVDAWLDGLAPAEIIPTVSV